MPIRFRCAYCNQLMGIATRKGGTVVTCPKCAGQVVVPKPEPDSLAEEPPAEDPALRGPNEVLEDEELAHLLEISQDEIDKTGHSIPTAAKAPASHRHAAESAPRSAKLSHQRTVRENEATVKQADAPHPEVAPLAGPPSAPGLFVPMPIFYILNAVGVFLLVMTFVAGYWIGKSATPAPQPVVEKHDAK